MSEPTTTNSILAFLKTAVQENTPLSPSTFVDEAGKLAILLGDENNLLTDLQQKVAQLKVGYIQQGEPVAKANARIEATDTYKEMQRQKSRITQILELIKISKLRARISMEEMQGY